MSFSKIPGSVAVILAALVVMAVSPQLARADTLFLKCGTFSPLTIDLTRNTVNNIPANITPISIDWTNSQGEFPVNLHIDRVAGTLTFEHHGTHFGPETCAAVSQPPTKF